MLAVVVVAQTISGDETRRRKLHQRSRTHEVRRVETHLSAHARRETLTNLPKDLAFGGDRVRVVLEASAAIVWNDINKTRFIIKSHLGSMHEWCSFVYTGS